ncbi:NIPSNAP protein [Mucilaginibacter gracilis]|uniref:NIPSNAP family protein n=2 Tax=Mucilaginibacter TaxID=423349 RepID=H1Y680_9SPHI|nr:MULTISPECIES: NIPSNAP family protein [Mucilaginibacter]EHQ24828.1 NIPSNAP family protein [Mucilaginibacter paludis DSM 18603]RKR82006.1 NIPSNAP protein [Mucilaginibacter gracilis]
MDQLRIYTLADKETAAQYFTANWAKHRINLPKFGFEVKGVWIGNTPGIANQVIALVSFPDDGDADEMTERYLKSAEFAADTAGFDRNKIINIETKILRSGN